SAAFGSWMILVSGEPCLASADSPFWQAARTKHTVHFMGRTLCTFGRTLARLPRMAYVVADPCVKCKYTDCVAVCPVDCFYEGKTWVGMKRDECIDCGACEPECPTTAIFEESELPSKWSVFKDINSVVSGAKKVDEVDTASWPGHLKDQVANVETWPNIT